MESVLKKMTLDFFGEGRHKITPEELIEAKNVLLLDVRTIEEVGSLSISLKYHPNIEYKNIPLHELPDRLNEVSREKFIAVFCPGTVRETMAYTYLLLHNYENARIIEGGYPALSEIVLPGKMLKVIRKGV
ncbi:Rhodanese domain protein [Chloroherpeton thalassium ATCC 35110]|uniref:Rhodanese domain protein n=1 Tax=Chloroherpeton thalassium (strain ATCC 35110 / GB-78) TaxID=517418 RepID=B3QWZ5_CHLT3|nr:rhodanese-like domain-containing protein [Chloroherpeton thalassium]ACF13359.1 Rhodanese domain protein [Chloroherpeton thalassium ATCC 35110]